MRLVTWNIRGLNKIPRQKEVSKFLRGNKVSMMAILEHKVKEQKVNQTMKRITTDWEWAANYEFSSKGRIWLVWDVMEV